MTFEHGPEPGSPFVHGATVFRGKYRSGLAEATACRQLPAGPAQPGFEIRAVGIRGEHGARFAAAGLDGQEDTWGSAWRLDMNRCLFVNHRPEKPHEFRV